MKVNISGGNSKLGSIPNFSLRPVSDCRPDAPCKRDCYALKAWRLYPACRKNWTENSAAARSAPEFVADEISAYVRKHNCRFFRFHVAGDFVSREYAVAVIRCAAQNPECRFLAFTKRPEFLTGLPIPENMTVIQSCWPGWQIPPAGRKFPKAYMQDGKVKVPPRARACPGNCETCGACWSLRKGESVVFEKH